MLNIKEIALRVAQAINLHYIVTGEMHTNDDWNIRFATALIAEIAKQNKPVAYATTSEDGDMAMLFFDDGEARKYSGDDAPIKLYTIPPTAEQIANGTAWQPIETAPKDAFVLLAGPSGYTTIKTVFATGRMCSDYHKGRWIDHANDDLTDWGFEPTHWMPLPTPPKRSMEGV